MTEQDSVNELRGLSREASRLRGLLNKQTGRQLDSTPLKESIKLFVQNYFRNVRPHLLRLGMDLGPTDDLMQRILELANRRGVVSQYKSCISDLKTVIDNLAIATERQLSDVAGKGKTSVTPIEFQILSTLRQLSPSTAASYEQALIDLSSDRLSYRGTATELREILRETLDRLAPNSEVEQSPGFQLESGRDRPTMAQKARFILRQRGIAKTSIDAPKKAIEIIEGTVSSFVRSTYDRGSVDTHTATGISKPQVNLLKMYVDTVLCELLEIHSQK